MILTVTPSPAIDHTWTVDHLVPGESHRVLHAFERAGGKGINVARALRGAGHDVLALATRGGETGRHLAANLHADGLPHVLLPVSAPTRRTMTLVSGEYFEATVFNGPGGPILPGERTNLMSTISSLASRARAVGISGSLPPGFGPDELAESVSDVVASGTPVVVDTSGPGIIAAARAGATVLKPNRVELMEATGTSDLRDAARELLYLGADLVLVSLGSDGLTLAKRSLDGMLLIHARLPRPVIGNATGAGDAAVAATLVSLALGVDAESSLEDLASLARAATAWSASAVLMPYAGDLSPDREELARGVELTVETVREPS